MEHETKKRNEMRLFLVFILLIAIVNWVFNLNFSAWVWVILFFLVCLLAFTQVMDTKLRSLDKRIKELEDQNKKD